MDRQKFFFMLDLLGDMSSEELKELENPLVRCAAVGGD